MVIIIEYFYKFNYKNIKEWFFMKFLRETKITFLYLIFGTGWIIFSDLILENTFPNQKTINTIQSYKGIIYVLITAYLLYLILHKNFKSLRQQRQKLQKNYKKLEEDNQEFQTLYEEIEDSYKEINDLANNIEKMIDLTLNLDSFSGNNSDNFLADLLHTSLKLINKADYGMVAKIENNKLIFIEAQGYDINELNQLSLTQKSLKQIDGMKTLNHLHKNHSKIKSSKLDKLLNQYLNETNDSLIVSFNDGQEKVGMLSLTTDNNSQKSFASNSQRIMSAFRSLANSFFKIQKYYQAEEDFQQELIISIIQILEIHDPYTEGHSKNVANLSKNIAIKMNLSQDKIDKAYWAGMVHDIGKILIPKSILNKDESLTNYEYQKIKKHPVWGYQALNHSRSLKNIASIILHHHERWDGNGYPQGLEKEEIPLISRIIGVADSWDSMRSQRPYRAPLPLNKALDEIKENKGSQFCPEVADTFLEVYKDL